MGSNLDELEGSQSSTQTSLPDAQSSERTSSDPSALLPLHAEASSQLWKGMCEHCGREAVFLRRYSYPNSGEHILLCTLCGQAMMARGWQPTVHQ